MYQNTLKRIKEIVELNRLHSRRLDACSKLYGVEVEEKVSSMGPGGTGLIRYFPKLNITRIQIGCNYNGFAPCAYVPGNTLKEINVNFLRDLK